MFVHNHACLPVCLKYNICNLTRKDVCKTRIFVHSNTYCLGRHIVLSLQDTRASLLTTLKQSSRGNSQFSEDKFFNFQSFKMWYIELDHRTCLTFFSQGRIKLSMMNIPQYLIFQKLTKCIFFILKEKHVLGEMQGHLVMMTRKITDKNKILTKCGKIAKWYSHFRKQPEVPKK